MARRKTRNTQPVRMVRNGKQPPITDTRGAEKMEIDYFRFFQSLYRKEVNDWQNARAARRNPFTPLTYPIQQLYNDAMLDNHLQGAIENRILKILKKEFVLKSPDGKIDRACSRFVQKRWMRHLVRKGMESKFYGYNIPYISEYEPGNILKIIDIPRENIIPEKGLILKDAMNPNGECIHYADFPNSLIYVQLNPDAVGTLERLAPLTIYKRHSWAAWDEFEQIFGVPIRVARTMIKSEKHKDELQYWLENMGTASYAILDKQVDIEIKENLRTDAYNVFLQKVIAINKEISKGVIGQTMTMDDGSSQSQAEVHRETYQDITDADVMDIQDWISDDFLPVMRNLGYDIPQGYYFELVDKSISSPKEKIKVDGELLRAGVRLSKNYLENTYDVEIEEDSEPEKQEKEEVIVKEEEEKSKDKKNRSLSFFD